MVAPGQFVLHSHVIPDLPAGTYTVQVEQDISAPGATPSIPTPSRSAAMMLATAVPWVMESGSVLMVAWLRNATL